MPYPTAYLANIGTRDVQLDVQPTQAPRADGADWLARYDELAGRLSAPILEPGLGHALRFTDRLSLFLFYTDQEETTPASYRKGDTVHFVALLQRLLSARFPDRLHLHPIRLEGNPADHDAMWAFFTAALPQRLPDAEAVFVAPVGGIGAANVALTLAAVEAYRHRCQFVYVYPDGGVRSLALHERLVEGYAREEARAHLTRYDFAAIGQTLKQAGLGDPWHLALCDYADRRARFDFQRAEAALHGVRMHSGEARLLVQRYRLALRPFLDDRPAPTSASDSAAWEAHFEVQRRLLGELYYNLRLKAAQGAWVDFLGRLFRLQEALLRLVFEQETRHSTEKHRQQFDDFVQGIASRPPLQASLDAGKIRYTEPTTRTLREILGYWVEQEQKKFGPVWGLMKDEKRWERLGTLRNKSIVAHGYRGVSAEDVAAAAGQEAPALLDAIGQAVAHLGVETAAAGPYEEAAREIRRLLGRG